MATTAASAVGMMINLALLWWWRDEYKKWVAREKQVTGIEQAG
tara:strand:- start:150 stop:278 length:129 start_codon:yes stop_codon:yes gene_type:complete